MTKYYLCRNTTEIKKSIRFINMNEISNTILSDSTGTETYDDEGT